MRRFYYVASDMIGAGELTSKKAISYLGIFTIMV